MMITRYQLHIFAMGLKEFGIHLKIYLIKLPSEVKCSYLVLSVRRFAAIRSRILGSFSGIRNQEIIVKLNLNINLVLIKT